MNAAEERVTAATTAAVERGVGVLLGATAEAAAAAVAVIVAAGRLEDGIALPAALHAARRGTDVVGAVDAIAGGAPLPEGWSDFERRAAVEELTDDLGTALHPPAHEGRVDVSGPDGPAVAASAVRRGTAAALRVTTPAAPSPADRVAERWVRALADTAGWPLHVAAPSDPGGAVAGSAAGSPPDAVVTRSADHIALLG